MKTKTYIQLAAGCAALTFVTGCVSLPGAHFYGAHVYRVPCYLTSPSQQLDLFIATGSKADPLVTLADNNGYPSVTEIYARPATFNGQDGISMGIRFAGPAQGRGLAINVLQEGMTENYKVMHR